MAEFVALANRNDGVVAVETKIHPDGSFEPDQLDVLKAIGRRVKTPG
jgi:hypothetical protein